MADPANQIFLPWVQPGAAVSIPEGAVEQLSARQAAAVSLEIALRVNSESLVKQARFYGPADVVAIDPQQVVRLEPRPGTTDFEPNYFPSIEFDRPDFPWLFTPLKSDAQGRLRPWLCLVVVRRQEGVALRRTQSQTVPVLTIGAPAVPGRELPDLAESHLWAHAQVTGATRAGLRRALESQPARNVSRLLCPRRLDPATEYLACVVPAFEVGRRAGLGLPPGTSETLAPAWQSGANAPPEVTLPVYYAWEFRTGEGGDFEELVGLLEPRVLPAEVGKRPIDVGRPGFIVEPAPEPGAPGTVLGLEGALRLLGSAPDEWPEAIRLPFQTALAQILNAPWELATREDANRDPIVGPPVYGCWHAGAHLVAPADVPSPPWLNELNLDPRHRAVAALGTRVVQEQQEQLMASAWEQLGDIERINQRLRQAQLSRAVNEKYLAKTFSRLPPETFMRIVAPAQSRVVLEERPPDQPSAPPEKSLLASKLTRSFVPRTAIAAPMRKLASPRSAINRTFSKAGASGANEVFKLFNKPPPSAPDKDRGAVTIDRVSDFYLEMVNTPSVTVRTPTGERLSAGFIWNPIPVGHWQRVSVAFRKMIDEFRLAKLATPALMPTTPPPLQGAVLAHHQHLSRVFSTIALKDARRVMELSKLKVTILQSLVPGRTVAQAVLAGIHTNSPTPRSGDELEPIMDAPDFPQPMYEALRDISQDFLFPGLEFVPPNTVQLLQTNAKFVESFMVGLNAEMGRELLWRDYPTDQRGTYFRQFWDTVGAAQARPDIPPIHRWGNRALGTTAVGAGGDKLVLLIRGELLRRYPNTVIYAVKATINDGMRELATDHPEGVTPPLVAYPIFRGALEPDVTFIGFDLRRSDVTAGHGWFFVLQQQPTEPRFGLDDAPFSEGESGKIPELTSWNDLNWAHLAPTPAKLQELTHVAVGKTRLAPITPSAGTWGRNSAHMAYITKQLPVRVAIHASELMPGAS